MIDEPLLWQRQCADCPLIGPCGGAIGAPCACAFVGTPLAYQCDTCVRICRERRGAAPAEMHLRTTRPLSEIDLSGVRSAYWTPPAFVPTRTDELDAVTASAVIGVMLRRLLSLSGEATYHGLAAGEGRRRLCAELRAQESAHLIAVLHADDATLVRFWRSDRRQLFAHLKSLGFAAATGPTFSVVTDTRQRLPFENHLSLRQHHQVIQEIVDAGLVPIPNLYAAGSVSEAELAFWLRDQPSVRLVSRDFSRTKGNGPDFRRELSQLSRILEAVGRPVHVLLLGISIGKAAVTADALRAVGASCSIVSGQPIIRAIFAGERLVASGASGRFVKARSLEKQWLAAENLRTADCVFTRACSGLKVARKSRAAGNRWAKPGVSATPDRKARPA